ncbi:PQQ-binding-like beta-propeller repeat protein [bacterium]|nr:PQQ-binding-like beta-propeller repeat protein [bacterium]
MKANAIITSLLLLVLLPLIGCDEDANNLPPGTPQIISGSDSVEVDEFMELTVVTVDPENDEFLYEIDWGDEREIEVVNEGVSGLYYTFEHSYFDAGSYTIRCRVLDVLGRRSAWSDPFHVLVGGELVSGRSNWWMFMGDAQHSGRSPFEGPDSPVLAWSLERGSPIRSSACFDARGTVYFGCDNFLLHAYYRNGRLKWTYWTGSARIGNGPALQENGSLCFGSSSANVYSVDRYGRKEWNYSVGAPVGRSSVVLDAQGKIYIGGSDNALTCLHADGTVAWRRITGGAIEGGPALSPDESMVYIGSADQLVYAYNTNGELQWTFPASAPFRGSPAVDALGTIYIASTDNMLYALRPDGTRRWSHDLHAPVYSTPALTATGSVYVSTAEGKLYRIDVDGQLEWALEYAQGGGLASPVLDVRETAYIGSPDGILTAVSADGSVRWRFDSGDPINVTAAIGPEGRIAFGNDKGRFFLLEAR